MRSYLIQQLPWFVCLTGSAAIHIGVYCWSLGMTRIDLPPPPGRGPNSVAIRLQEARPFRPPTTMSEEVRRSIEGAESATPPILTSQELPRTQRAIPPKSPVPPQAAFFQQRSRSATERTNRQTDRVPPAKVHIQRQQRPPADPTSSVARAARDNQGAVAPPVVITNPKPKYPEQLRARGIGGSVTFQFVISRAGRAQAIRLISSSGQSRLDDSARETLSRWRFHPAKRKGMAVAHPAQHTFRFVPRPN